MKQRYIDKLKLLLLGDAKDAGDEAEARVHVLFDELVHGAATASPQRPGRSALVAWVGPRVQPRRCPHERVSDARLRRRPGAALLPERLRADHVLEAHVARSGLAPLEVRIGLVAAAEQHVLAAARVHPPRAGRSRVAATAGALGAGEIAIIAIRVVAEKRLGVGAGDNHGRRRRRGGADVRGDEHTRLARRQ